MPIKTAEAPCWVLKTSDGREYEPEGVAHYPTQQAAIDERNRHVKDAVWLAPLHEYEPAQLDAPCFHASCDGCDYALDEDDWLYHFDTADDALAYVKDVEWKVLPSGALDCGNDDATPGER